MRIFLSLICTIFVVGFAHADTETINWYVGTTLYDTTSCQTGGDVNLPTAPTKYGYTFNGWTSGFYDMTSINTSINGTVYYSKQANGQCRYRTAEMSASVVESCTKEEYADLNNRLWKVLFSYGTVYGESRCSDTTASAFAETGDPADTTSTSKQCWCRVTGIVPTNSSVMHEPTAVSLWAFSRAYSSASACASLCSNDCGSGVQGRSSLRSALFGSVVN